MGKHHYMCVITVDQPMLLYSIYKQCGLHVMLYAVGTSDVRFTTFKAYSIQLCHRPWFIHQFPHNVYTDRDRRHLFYQVEKGMIKAIEGFGLCCCALRFYNCGTSAISELCDSNCKNQSRNNSNFQPMRLHGFLKTRKRKVVHYLRDTTKHSIHLAKGGLMLFNC